jgi:hypothetical protein
MKKALLAALFLLFINGSSWAANCSSFPFTLSEGTTAFATQVMSNLNSLLTCANNTLGKFTGPASSSDGDVVCFNGTTGQSGKACSSGVWPTYTPTVTCGSGGPNLSNATITGEYLRLGRQITVNINIAITTNGTCAGNWTISAPVTAGLFSSAFNLRMSSTGASGNCGLTAATTTLLCNKYDGTYPGGDGVNVAITGTYEALTN